MIARLVGVEGPQPWAAGSLQQVPVSYRTLANYYVNTYQETERVELLSAPTVVRVQMNVYAVASEALVWSAASRTFNPRGHARRRRGRGEGRGRGAPEGRHPGGGVK